MNPFTCYNEAADLGEHNLPQLDRLVPQGGFSRLAEFLQLSVDKGVEGDQGYQGDEAIEDQIHVDDIDFVVVWILPKTGSDNQEDLRT